ncbi:hypothetical protein [Methylotenera sp. L2L1]|uniref:hypothetical protein n=1 Tax=Methylotenera sp. L2L1 TaxID=1502770 RepID=UPI000691E1B5|nr:hypothetical protein [Methylotenera sp. L2L1]
MAIRCLTVLITLCLTSQACLSAEQTKQQNTTKKAKAQHVTPAIPKVSEVFKIQTDDLRQLMLQLYQCNQKDLLKSTKVSAEELTQWVFEGPFGWKFDAIRQAQSIDALSLSFSPEYQGDRILPLITGLHTMLVQAYGGENEFTFTKKILPKNLYHAARNIEITRQKLINTSNDTHHFHANCTSKQINEIDNTLTNIIKRTDHYAHSIGYTLSTKESAVYLDSSTSEFIRF